MSEERRIPNLPSPPIRTRPRPPQPVQVDVGKAQVTVVLDDGSQHVLCFEGDRNGPDPFDFTSQWVTTAKDQVESWLTFSAKKGFMRLSVELYVPVSRVMKVITEYSSHLVSVRRF